MKHPKSYLFTSERLGFRNWETEDIPLLAEINADEKVMEFFPATANLQLTQDFVTRMQQQYTDKGFCYFAVDTLADGTFIGFIGLSQQTYEAPFTPCVDIGWRISSNQWSRGYATEGAMRCLQYAFENLKLPKVYAVAPKINTKSEHLMKKIGMQKTSEFEHPLLVHDARLRTCVLYAQEP